VPLQAVAGLRSAVRSEPVRLLVELAKRVAGKLDIDRAWPVERRGVVYSWSSAYGSYECSAHPGPRANNLLTAWLA
jgi:hypothetical protein